MSIWIRHQALEKNSILLVIGILLVIAIGGIVEITPLFYLKSTIEKVDGMRPYTPLELAGRNIYVREGCYNCHSQMIVVPFVGVLRADAGEIRAGALRAPLERPVVHALGRERIVAVALDLVAQRPDHL